MKLFDKNGIDMCEGPLFGKIIRFSVPLMLTNILQLLYNAADIVVIGAFRGTIQVAAVGATSSFIALIVNVFMGLSVGVSVAVGKYIGQGRRDDIRETVQTTAGLSLVCGLLAMAVGMLLSRPMLVLMKTPEDVLPFALVYLRIYLLGSPANLAYNFLAAVLRAKGDTTRPFLILSTAGLVNVILNVICVALIGMDAEGVAIATVASQYLSAVLIIICMVRSTDDCRLELRKICLRRDKVAEITRMGLPSEYRARSSRSQRWSYSRRSTRSARRSSRATQLLAASTASLTPFTTRSTTRRHRLSRRTAARKSMTGCQNPSASVSSPR